MTFYLQMFELPSHLLAAIKERNKLSLKEHIREHAQAFIFQHHFKVVFKLSLYLAKILCKPKFEGKHTTTHDVVQDFLPLLLGMPSSMFCTSKHMFSQCHLSNNHGNEWILCLQ